ncbi:hypothetical protein [Nocardia inohanensis]|uniref:hypothetical protein n=1 Tax=Nocardia inohanensis TaxID=209246 RepID=UPI000836A33E|nr:hypothetical protein [Nocardia inohanensis]
MRVLAARLSAVAEGRAVANDFARGSMVARGAGEPETVRTYDLIAWRVTDHRRAITLPGPFEPETLDSIGEALRTRS